MPRHGEAPAGRLLSGAAPARRRLAAAGPLCAVALIVVAVCIRDRGAQSVLVGGALLVGAATAWLLLGDPAAALRPRLPPLRRPIRTARAGAIVTVLAVLGAAAVTLTVAPAPFVLDAASTSQYRTPVVAGMCLALIGVILAARVVTDRGAGTRPWAGRVLAVLLVGGALALQFRLAWAVAQYPPFDAAQIFSAAYRIAVGPETVLFDQQAQVAYFSMLPNNAFLAAFFSALFGVFGSLGVTGPRAFAWCGIAVNVLSIDLAVALLWTIARTIGTRFTTRVVLVFAAVLIVVSPWLTVFYSDTLALPFPLAVFAIFLAWRRRPGIRARAAAWAMIGVITAVGYSIKPTVLFAALALLVVEALQAEGAVRVRAIRTAVALATFGAVLGLAHLAVVGWIDSVGVLPYPLGRSARALPFTHFLAMGAGADGSYSQADVNASLATPAAERSKMNLSVYLDRVAAMGPAGYVLFLGRKLLFALSDGTFYQGREGVGAYDHRFFQTDSLSSLIQQVYPNFAPAHWLISSTWQAAWLLVLALCLVPLHRSTARRPIVVGLRVAVLLLLAFLLISESRSRYLYLDLPLLLLLAGFGAEAMCEHLAAGVRRLRRSPSRLREPLVSSPS